MNLEAHFVGGRHCRYITPTMIRIAPVTLAVLAVFNVASSLASPVTVTWHSMQEGPSAVRLIAATLAPQRLGRWAVLTPQPSPQAPPPHLVVPICLRRHARTKAESSKLPMSKVATSAMREEGKGFGGGEGKHVRPYDYVVVGSGPASAGFIHELLTGQPEASPMRRTHR